MYGMSYPVPKIVRLEGPKSALVDRVIETGSVFAAKLVRLGYLMPKIVRLRYPEQVGCARDSETGVPAVADETIGSASQRWRDYLQPAPNLAQLSSCRISKLLRLRSEDNETAFVNIS
jgi:hypothetical protein